jgi:hypothetical protein
MWCPPEPCRANDYPFSDRLVPAPIAELLSDLRREFAEERFPLLDFLLTPLVRCSLSLEFFLFLMLILLF